MGEGHETHFLFHPILIHFPIAFYFLELVLLLLWKFRREESYLRFALFSFQMGYGFMIVTAIAGLVDTGGLGHITGRVRTHALAAVTILILYTVRALFWRFGKAQDRHYSTTHVLFALAGNILVAVTGYFGGLLVYG